MIQVTPAPEPPGFDEKVRRRGLAALSELVGEEREGTRRGPKRKAQFARRDEIPADALPTYWRDALPDMLRSYSRMCAYLAPSTAPRYL